MTQPPVPSQFDTSVEGSALMEPRLQNQLQRLVELRRQFRRARAYAICWIAAAIAGLALLAIQFVSGHRLAPGLWLMPLVLGAIFSFIAAARKPNRGNEILDVIRELEPQHPELRHLLSAAAEQMPVGAGTEFTFLQSRVIEEALALPRHVEWRKQLKHRSNLAQSGQVIALMALVGVTLLLKHSAVRGSFATGSSGGSGITVTPGDVNVERGTGLVISIRFGESPPPDATLVLNSESDHESRLPMARRLADPIFGASIPEVTGPGIYHIEYSGKKTRDFKISVFDFPALVRADAELRYPSYTGLTNRTFLDALRVSAVEGSHLSYKLQLNKPVIRARLVGTNGSLNLVTQSNAVAVLPDFLLTNTVRFSLELVDADGRSNKFSSDFVFQALTNQRPIVRIVFPRGDPRVSRLQELQLQAEASDDFGLVKYGIGFGIAGQEPKFVELGQSAPANVKKEFSRLIPLETLGVEVDQAVAYFAWADDYGPDGRLRRTFSDMFFAEVRPFEEVFRPDQSGGGGQGSQGGGQGGGESTRLAELQKQIAVATWKLQQEKTGTGSASPP